MIDQGGLVLVAIAIVVFGGGWLLERWFLRVRPMFYFTSGFPLDPEPVPILRVPKAEAGKTASVRWERTDEVVTFWADPTERSAPMGLHGAIHLLRGTRGVHLIVRWSPPWTPMLAGGWLTGLGAVRGDWAMIPVGLALMLVILLVYRTYALRAAAELRWAFVSTLDPPDDPRTGAPPGM